MHLLETLQDRARVSKQMFVTSKMKHKKKKKLGKKDTKSHLTISHEESIKKQSISTHGSFICSVSIAALSWPNGQLWVNALYLQGANQALKPWESGRGAEVPRLSLSGFLNGETAISIPAGKRVSGCECVLVF